MIYMNRKVDGDWKSMYLAELPDFASLAGGSRTVGMVLFHGIPVERFEYSGPFEAVAEWCSRMNPICAEMREQYFAFKDDMKTAGDKEGRKLYLQKAPDSDWQYVDQEWVDSVLNAASKKSTGGMCALTDHMLLLSTRRLLHGIAPGRYYDGPEFKFLSNRHPSPAERFIPVLASRYMMNVVIPNSLLAREYGFMVDEETAMKALDYCMRTGKKPAALAYWDAYLGEGKQAAQYRLFSFYVNGLKSDGSEVPKEKRCFFKKFIDLKHKDAQPCRKSRNMNKVAELLERMKQEPELSTMSHRQLMATGISDRAARLFMKVREET